MYEFIEKDSFTLSDIFDSVLQHGKRILKETPKEQVGRLPLYLDTARRLREQVKPKNFSAKKVGLLLDEFDDGLSVKYPNEYPYALPLITSQADKKFCKIMLEHFEQTYEHRNKLNISDYPFYVRAAINVGLIWTLPKQAECLRERMDEFSSQCAYLKQFGLRHENKTLSDELPQQKEPVSASKKRKALMAN